jgi:hypothetical protein
VVGREDGDVVQGLALIILAHSLSSLAARPQFLSLQVLRLHPLGPRHT